MPRSVVVTGILLLAGWCARLPAQPAALDWIDFDRVDAGEILLQTENLGRGTVHIDLAISIDADWKSIWNVLTACEISPDYVPNVIACRRIATDDACNCELFEQTVKPAFFLPRFDHVFRLVYHEPERIDVSHVSGPIDTLDGSWLLFERPGEPTILMHRLTLKPGFPVPRLFVRQTLRRDLPTVLSAVRERAETAAAR